MPKDKPMSNKEIDAELNRINAAYFSSHWPNTVMVKGQDKGRWLFKFLEFKDSGSPMNVTHESQSFGYHWYHESECGGRGTPEEPGDTFYFNIWLKDYGYPKPTALLQVLESILEQMIANDEKIIVYMDDAGGDEPTALSDALYMIRERILEKK